MSNFEYIISSLPVLTGSYRYADGEGFGTVADQIRAQLSAADAATLDFLLRGFDAEALDSDFYAEALSHRNGFIRAYFRFDLHLRNAKVRFLNAALGRAEGCDLITGAAREDEAADVEGFRFRPGEFEEEAATEAILAGSDLLARERALDDLVWEKIDSLTAFHYFDLDAVLGYLCRLRIVDRWLVLDEEQGRTRFHRLVTEIKGHFQPAAYTG